MSGLVCTCIWFLDLLLGYPLCWYLGLFGSKLGLRQMPPLTALGSAFSEFDATITQWWVIQVAFFSVAAMVSIGFHWTIPEIFLTQCGVLVLAFGLVLAFFPFVKSAVRHCNLSSLTSLSF